MAHITDRDRSQTLLLPESLDDYVGPDNPVRFIEAFVDGLDLATTGFVHVQSKDISRPGRAPADLLKLYTYGYLNRVRSSRRREAETHRNIEVIRLRGTSSQTPTAPIRSRPRRALGDREFRSWLAPRR